jgi:hypothetical protein
MEAVVIAVIVHMAALVAVVVAVVALLFLTLNLTIIVLYMVLIHGRCVILTLMATITILLQVAGLPIPDAGEDTAVGMGATTIMAKIKIMHFTTTIMVAEIRAMTQHGPVHTVAVAGWPEAGLPTILIQAAKLD